MSDCRFCDIANDCEKIQKLENTKIIEDEDYFAISSVGALVEGWVLVVPKRHGCSMKKLYAEKKFVAFTDKVVSALVACYGPVIVFEHGPNHDGSDTSCGTNHAHIHVVPYRSLMMELNTMDMKWTECYASQVSELVGENEYLFYCEPGKHWNNPLGKVHILKKPISQFFRRIIAEDQGIPEKFNYKTNPDTVLTLKTIEKTKNFFPKYYGVKNV